MAVDTVSRADHDEATTSNGKRKPLLQAAGAATVALVAAVVAAVGPARGESAEYTWPPPILSSSKPARGWYAPLPLLNRVPSSIVVRLPCDLAPPLINDRSVTVVATARRPEQTDGLRIALVDDSLLFAVGRPRVAEVPWPAACPLHLEVREGELRLPGRTVVLSPDTLEHMPIVTGLFTNLDLRAGRPPHVVVRTRDYATSPTARQSVAAAVALAFAAIAILLMLRHDPGRRSRRLRHHLVSAWRARDPADAVVVGVLLVWWILAPAYTDDGWFWAEYRAFSDVGALSFLFDHWAVVRPVGYWVGLLGQWTMGWTNDLAFMRLPSLVALLACWPLCGACLRMALGKQPTLAARWILAGAFLVGATAWGMTLRPEPLIALLTLVSLTAMVSFRLGPRIAPLAIAMVAAVLALTAHPTGIVALAPLIAGAPHAVGALRTGGRRFLGRLGLLLVAGIALGLVLFTFDADLAHRVSDARVVSQGEDHGEPFWREYIRYTRFDVWGGGTPLRRLSLVLMAVSVAAALSHRRSVRTGIMSLPASSLGVGLVLLALVPSKWPWHFGALIAVAAVATSAEVERLARERAAVPRAIRPTVALLVLSGVALVAWSAPGFGSPLELQEVSFRDGFNGYTWLILLLVLPAAAVLTGRMISRRRRREAPDLVPFLTRWVLSLILFGAIAVTIALRAIDATKAPWSPVRQNIEALVGRSSCGLAHQFTGDGSLADRLADSSTPTLVHPTVGVFFGCETTPRIADGLAEMPAAVVVNPGEWQLFLRGSPFTAAVDLYELQPVAQGPGLIRAHSVRRAVPGFARANADLGS